MGRYGVLYLASVAVHGAMAAGISALRQAPQHETVAISVIEEAPRPDVAPPPEAVPPPPEAATSEPSPTKNSPPPVAALPAAPLPAAAKLAPAEEPARSSDDAADVPDFGVTLSGGSGGGFALPAGDPRGRVGEPRGPAPHPRAVRPKVNAEEACQEPLVKARPVTVPEPSYTEAARESGVAGKVRVEMSIDVTGRVTSAKILAGLGYGLDEAALASARRATFEPAARCGRPVASMFVVAMRFSP